MSKKIFINYRIKKFKDNKYSQYEKGARNMKNTRQLFIKRKSFRLMLLMAVMAGLLQTPFGQNVKNTDYSADKFLKSNARVNPSTLAMELSIPIASYPGRAESSLPAVFDYSSKVWQIKTGDSF